MSDLYNRISGLCAKFNVNITTMCKESGASRASLSDLKMGRKQSLSADTLDKIADYFDTTVDYLLGRTNDAENNDRFGLEDPADHTLDFILGTKAEKALTTEGERPISDDEIKFALFGGDGEITDAMYDEVKRFAHMVKLREDAEKKKE